jgi:hypothetical protein
MDIEGETVVLHSRENFPSYNGCQEKKKTKSYQCKFLPGKAGGIFLIP